MKTLTKLLLLLIVTTVGTIAAFLTMLINDSLSGEDYFIFHIVVSGEVGLFIILVRQYQHEDI